MLFAFAAVAERQGLFGNRFASFDDGQDAQGYHGAGDNYDGHCGGFVGFHDLDEEETEDLGTDFGGDEDHQQPNNHYHPLPPGYSSRPRRPINSGPPIIGQGAPRRRKGGKLLRLPGQEPRSDALTQRNLNIMTKKHQKGGKKSASAATGRATTTRSNTENDRLKKEVEAKKKEMEAKEKELQEFKRKYEDLQNKGGDDTNKKAKKDKHVVKPKKNIAGTWLELKNAFRNEAYAHYKFMSSEDDEVEVMIYTLKYCSWWPQLKDLSQEDLEAEAKSYVEVYGPQITAEMNELRTQHQSAIRKVWIDMRKKGPAPSAKMLLKVARRNPKYLQVLDEEGGTPEENEKNKALNKQNERYRDRFKDYILYIVPTCIQNSCWSKDLAAEHILSDYVDLETGLDIVPAAVEAMAILFVENNDTKWEWQTGVELNHSEGVQKYKETLKAKGQPLSDEEKEPATKFSSSKCGAKAYGGWSNEGKKRFREIKKIIEQGRALDTTKEIEEHFRDVIKKELEGTKKKKKAKKEVVSALLGDEEEEEDSEPDYESCDSDEEQEVLNQHRYLTKEEKAELEKKRKEQEEQEEQQQQEQQQEDAGGQESGEAGNANSGTAAAKGKKSTPPAPQQQQRQTRGNGGRRSTNPGA